MEGKLGFSLVSKVEEGSIDHHHRRDLGFAYTVVFTKGVYSI